VSADYNLHRINTHFIWLFQLPLKQPKSNTRVETEDRQTDINEFIKLYKKSVQFVDFYI